MAESNDNKDGVEVAEELDAEILAAIDEAHEQFSAGRSSPAGEVKVASSLRGVPTNQASPKEGT